MTEGAFHHSMIASGQARLPVAVDPKARCPVVYEEAVKKLEAVETIDEGKYFEDQAEALAAWAKIYNDDRAADAARRLKLHAYRRCGILAQQQRPTERTATGRITRGPRSLLVESGFKGSQAQAAVAVARMPEREFRRVVEQPRPPSPAMLVQVGTRKNPAAAKVAVRFSGLLSVLRKSDLAEFVAAMDTADVLRATRMNTEAIQLITKFQAQIDRRKERST
jgi:hypothetical protein